MKSHILHILPIFINKIWSFILSAQILQICVTWQGGKSQNLWHYGKHRKTSLWLKDAQKEIHKLTIETVASGTTKNNLQAKANISESLNLNQVLSS